MRIGELSRRTGVSPRSLRYYEQRGLLTSTRTSGGHREYGEWAVERVSRVQTLYAAGLNSDVVASILPCIHDHDGGPNERATHSLAEELSAEAARIDNTIAGLVRTREVLDQVMAAARLHDERSG